MNDSIIIKEGDYGISIHFELIRRNSSGDYEAIDITGYTPYMIIYKSSTQYSEILCSVDDSANGKITCELDADDIPSVGRYNCEIELRGTNYKESSKTFNLLVMESA